MRIAVLGGSGALGAEVMLDCERRGWSPVNLSRSSSVGPLNVTDLGALTDALDQWAPDAVINCAALVDIPACEAVPATAWSVNARPVATLAHWSRRTGYPLVQVSTDNFFVENDGPTPHDETAPITLLTEYARTKYAAEAFALTSPNALVVRTNMAAAWPGRTKNSIVAWAMDAFETRAPIRLFDDYYCSTLDAPTVAKAIGDLLERKATGLVHVGCREVASKLEFVNALAVAAGVHLDWAQAASAADLDPPRAIHVGLDVRKAESLLGYDLPTLEETARRFVEQRRSRP